MKKIRFRSQKNQTEPKPGEKRKKRWEKIIETGQHSQEHHSAALGALDLRASNVGVSHPWQRASRHCVVSVTALRLKLGNDDGNIRKFYKNVCK